MATEQKLSEMFGSEWRQHAKYVNYFFSRDGRCARVPKIAAPRLLIGCEAGSMPYRAISLCDGSGMVYREYLHRLVCELFNGPPQEGLHCRHLDGDIKNCAADNLAWGTPVENMDDMRRHGRIRYGRANPMAKLTVESVAAMRTLRATDKLGYKTIAAQFGVSTMTALRAIKGESWK